MTRVLPPPGTEPLDDPLGYASMVVFQTGERLRRFLAAVFTQGVAAKTLSTMKSPPINASTCCVSIHREHRGERVLPVRTIRRLLGLLMRMARVI